MKIAKIILILSIIAYALYFSWVSIARHQSILSGRYDLGNMEQTVWNTSRGRIFMMTDPETGEFSSRLAYHADFFLILIAPIYKIFPFTETLLILQALLVSLGAIPVYLIANKIFSVGEGLMTIPIKIITRFLTDAIPLLFAILYLSSPIIQRANIFDFHSEVPAATFLLFTFYFLLIKKRVWFLIFFLLSLVSKETVALPLSMICLWGIVKNKNRRLSLLLFIFCIAYFIAMVKFAIPAANSRLDRHFALREFTEGDEKLFQVIVNYAKNPLNIIKTFFQKQSLVYYWRIFSSTGFLALFSPLTLLFSVPPMMINVFARGTEFRSLSFHYSATIVPGLIISTIYGSAFLIKQLHIKKGPSNGAIEQWNNRYFFVFLYSCIPVFIIVLNLRVYSPLPFIGKTPYFDFLTYHNPAAEKIIYWSTRIPEESSVSVTNNAGAHFARRRDLFFFPSKIGQADYVIIADHSWFEWVKDKKRDEIIADLKNNPKYKLLDETSDFWIFKRQSSGFPE